MFLQEESRLRIRLASEKGIIFQCSLQMKPRKIIKNKQTKKHIERGTNATRELGKIEEPFEELELDTFRKYFHPGN